MVRCVVAARTEMEHLVKKGQRIGLAILDGDARGVHRGNLGQSGSPGRKVVDAERYSIWLSEILSSALVQWVALLLSQSAVVPRLKEDVAKLSAPKRALFCFWIDLLMPIKVTH